MTVVATVSQDARTRTSNAGAVVMVLPPGVRSSTYAETLPLPMARTGTPTVALSRAATVTSGVFRTLSLGSVEWSSTRTRAGWSRVFRTVTGRSPCALMMLRVLPPTTDRLDVTAWAASSAERTASPRAAASDRYATASGASVAVSIGPVTAWGSSSVVANRPTEARAPSRASTDSGSSSFFDAVAAAGARRTTSCGCALARALSGWSAIQGASSRALSSALAVAGSGFQVRGSVARSWAASAGSASAWRATTAVSASTSWSAAVVSPVRARSSLSWSSATRAVASPAPVFTVVTASGVSDVAVTGDSGPSSPLRATTSGRPERTAAARVTLSGVPVAGHARSSCQVCRRSVSVADVPQRAVVTEADPRGTL